jgi:endonuclease/exonuclease/phosphatase family metal-dependent hydrolase
VGLNTRRLQEARMTYPVRLSLATYNLWGTERWPARAPALAAFCDRYRPDVLCVQELTPETRAFLDDQLPSHARVTDPYEGWTVESNLWWRSDLFHVLGAGAEDVGIVAYPRRRLFWVRLQPQGRDPSFVVATVHLTDAAGDELRTGITPRVRETEAVIAALAQVVGEGEPAFLTGDFNDALLPVAALFAAGYTSCFGALAQFPPPTMPTSLSRFGVTGFSTAFVYDWIVANSHARAVSASSPHVYADEIAPSDHWPVHAVYELAAAARTA